MTGLNTLLLIGFLLLFFALLSIASALEHIHTTLRKLRDEKGND